MTAVIVNWNAKEHLLACIASLRADGTGQVVVVDNDSADGSQAALAAADSEAVFVATGSNLGFGAAANRGVAVTRSPYVFILNPDTVVAPGTAAILAATLDADGGLAMVGPRVDRTDGTVYPSARRFPALGVAMGHGFIGLFRPNNRFTRRYRMLDNESGAPVVGSAGVTDVDWVSGTAMLVRRSAFDQVGGFDERYFMYVEDVDLCWRLGRAGWRIGYQPAGRVTHVIGVSSAQVPYRMIAAHHRSMLRFASKTTTGHRRCLLPVIAVGLVVRTVAAWVRHRIDHTPPAAR